MLICRNGWLETKFKTKDKRSKAQIIQSKEKAKKKKTDKVKGRRSKGQMMQRRE